MRNTGIFSHVCFGRYNRVKIRHEEAKTKTELSEIETLNIMMASSMKAIYTLILVFDLDKIKQILTLLISDME